MSIISSKHTAWFKSALFIAGIYHILWGISVLFFPCFWFDLCSLSHPNYIHLWQLIGGYEIIFGIGFLMIAPNPLRHWRLLLLSFIAKLAIVVGFTYFYHLGEEPFIVFNMILTNHLLWLIPFGIILYNAYHHQYLLDNDMIQLNKLELNELLDFFELNDGNNLKEESEKHPIMLVFLRRFGCLFCRETLEHLKKLQPEIEAKGTKIVLVHMHHKEEALEELKKFNLESISSVSDPESILYKGFHLKRGTFFQLFGIKVLFRGIYLWLTKGTFSSIDNEADLFQMPGVFLVFRGKIIKQYVHRSAADIPPYLALCACDECTCVNPI
ncbi:MAG TPA: SelL-related redox protein [Chitinophagales bacterium]|jgi:peroxiredoxin|nr:redoxin domain-containing protein [Chitinophagales bacterium]MBP6154196.1 redoxin domain-containing protein [Chitinophagales bacterium]HQV78669.1 SelL-related redox protein [Chitinophagales bacterium]HQW78945.1 SelL-related redox protein [Chitinophagales bacterium]HRB19628.1 SelL-related redox protein [Chitinophagales bacterium]